MDQERRKFLRQLATACAAGVAKNLAIGTSLAAGAAATATSTALASASTAAAAGATAAEGAYGVSVRGQVFEVIVRQAIAGTAWKSICAGPLQVNNISEEEIENEVKRRVEKNKHTDKNFCLCRECLARRLEIAHKAWAEHQTYLDAILHTENAPCPCNDCYQKIYKIRQ